MSLGKRLFLHLSKMSKILFHRKLYDPRPMLDVLIFQMNFLEQKRHSPHAIQHSSVARLSQTTGKWTDFVSIYAQWNLNIMHKTTN